MNNPETCQRFSAAPSMTDHMVRIIKIAIYLKFLALYRAIEMMIRIFYLCQIWSWIYLGWIGSGIMDFNTVQTWKKNKKETIVISQESKPR